MTNYSKWDKFAADLASDTESEEERELVNYTSKNACYIHVPPKDFSNKEQLCKILEDAVDFAPPSSSAAGIMEEDSEPEAGVVAACKNYGWTSIGSQSLPGYGAAAQGKDAWRVYFDDNFLTTQSKPNRGARALIGHQSLGSFVVACYDRDSGKDRPISRKEVADLIINRQQGKDAEKINLEHEKQQESQELFKKLGVDTINLKGPES
mmetsp:Transcript_58976/g.140814  ORF Transcript_58976/g.140814 Transcript_58976/m.140814 type:complete len:208 (+) Transcript_58976:70-693(+)